MTDITDKAAKSRYELVTDGYLSIADYRKDGNNLAITHVEVPHALRSKGIAARLMEGVLLDAKNKGLNVIPICSYAVSYIQRQGK